eukprot:gene7809-8620_t
MHGLGDSAEGLEDLAQAWRQQLPHVKFVLPTAPTRAITRFMGQSTTAWFNINSNSDRYQDPCEGLEDSADFVQSLVRAEQALGLPRKRIKPRESAGEEEEGPLGGLLILSAYLPKVHSFTLHGDYRSVPVLHCHGDADQMIRLEWAQKTKTFLDEAGMEHYELKVYRGLGHSVNGEILQEAQRFLSTVLPAEGSAPVPPPLPKEMSVKELKEAIRGLGLVDKAVGLNEKQDLIRVVEDYYREHNLRSDL